MKKRILKVIYIIFVVLVLCGFYYINTNNYTKLSQIKYSIVKHPELLPKKDIAKYTSFGFNNLKADIYWLEAIQYIGSNAIGSEYKKYLYTMLDLITELNPFFEKPYLIGQLLLPNTNERYENITTEESKNYTLQGEKIGLKGIKNFCDNNKIQKIITENDLNKIWTNNEYKNPCKSSDIPFSQAFLYYYYLKEPLKSANYYKVSSAIDKSLDGAKIMAAIMSGKSGDREKSIMMFLTLATQDKNNKDCNIFSNELQKVYVDTFINKNKLDSKTLKNIETLRKTYFTFDENLEKQVISGDNCSNYINKAVREYNLYYLDEANKKYFNDNKKYAQTPEELLKNGYINYNPKDFQQYKDYGIIYFFNDEIGNFDYKMGN